MTTVFVTHDQEEAMDLASEIVVMKAGRIEQIGTAKELYEQPSNEFVMSFVGPVSRVGDALLRPHEIQLLEDRGDGGTEALVQRIVHLGFEVRVELTLQDGTEIWAQVTKDLAEQMELREGQIVAVRMPTPRTFA
jgi:sulfate transport system ATP-binding protein